MKKAKAEAEAKKKADAEAKKKAEEEAAAKKKADAEAAAKKKAEADAAAKKDPGQTGTKGVSIGALTGFAGGKIDQGKLKSYVQGRKKDFEKCAAIVGKDKAIKGKLVLRITVETNGRGSAAVVTNGTGVDALASCVSGKIRQWSFPAPEGGKAQFVLPATFK